MMRTFSTIAHLVIPVLQYSVLRDGVDMPSIIPDYRTRNKVFFVSFQGVVP